MASQLVKSFLRRARHNARAGTPAYALVHDTKRQFASKQVDTFKRGERENVHTQRAMQHNHHAQR